MTQDHQPLFSLNIGEFKEFTKQLVEDTLQILKQKHAAENVNPGDQEVFTIDGLMVFLNCSKVSIHNYKKKGLPYYRIGRKLLFKKDEVLAFMKSLKGKRH